MKRTVAKRAGGRRAVPGVSILARRRMEAELRAAEERVALSALDALSAQIAILDGQGNILAVNKAWRDLARERNARGEPAPAGAKFFAHCDNASAANTVAEFAEGVQAVLRGRRSEFAMEYPCRVGHEERWFHGKVTRFAGPKPVRVVIAHEDISERVRLEREIVAVSAREQQRFGQELHDGLSQQLTGLKFKASLLEYQLQSKNLPEAGDAKAISELLNAATDEASKLARSVRPVEVDARGLMMALRELAARTEQEREITCMCLFRRPVFIHDPNVATNVYRIAEEAVVNAVTHGEARRVSIHLTESRNSITLTVRDDGRGIAPRQPNGAGLGIHMMRYRARIIGGSLELRRNFSGGTSVTCSFQRRTAPSRVV